MEKVELASKTFIIRKLEDSDLERALEFADYLNELVDDPEALILQKSKKTSDEEREWLLGRLPEAKSAKSVMLVVECDSSIIGLAGAHLRPERADHVAEVGVSILKGYRGIGLGSVLFEKIIESAKELNPRPAMLRLSAFGINKRAISTYEKHGFKEVARIPDQFQLGDQLVDEVVMVISLYPTS